MKRAFAIVLALLALPAGAITIDSAQVTIDSTWYLTAVQFGSAIFTPLNPGQPGITVNEPAYLIGSAASYQTAYFDPTGASFIPSSIQYRIDDLLSGAEILAPTTLPVGRGNTIMITSAQNEMISVSRSRETHVLTVIVTDGFGGSYQQRTMFQIVRSP
jgi:hypothetical protein